MKKPQTEVAWSEEDLAYAAWMACSPGKKAFGETPEAAALALERLERPESAEAPLDMTPGSAPEQAAARPVAAKRKEKATRLEAASLQLDAAIRLYFCRGEPLAVHALATAAGEVFADRLARWGGKSEGDSLPREEYLRILKEARALLRATGGEEVLEFDSGRNDAVIAQVLTDRIKVCPSRPLSRDMALFRDWYRAARSSDALPEAPVPHRGRPSRPQASELQISLL